MKCKILNIFLLLNIFKLLNSEYIFYDPIKNYTISEFVYSMEKDLGQCTCDISSLCDYNWPCDKDCTDEDKKKFNEIGTDFSKYNKERMEEFKCKNKNDNFKYNKNKAGISVKDHIFSLMCVHYDRSGDMGEFYKEVPNDDDSQKQIENDWKNKFFNTTIENNNLERIYKPDSNGFCVNSTIKEIKNNEYSCLENNNDFDKEYEQKYNKIQYGNGKQHSIKIDQNKKEYKVLLTDSDSKIVDFKIIWEKEKDDKVPQGYMRGTPIKIKNSNGLYYQFYFPISDKDGYCINDSNENISVNMKTILFKNNAIYSCRKKNNEVPIIFSYLNENFFICSSPNDNSCDDKINGIDNLKQNNVNIELNIYTVKTGKQYKPYEKIKFSQINAVPNENKDIFSFKIKFYDVSYSSYINQKKGKITSLNSIPDEIMKALSEEKNWNSFIF